MTSVAAATTGRFRAARWLPWALWIGLTIALVVTVPALPWQRAVAELKGVRLFWAGVAILANLLILPLWAIEWRLLVPARFGVSLPRMFEIVAATAAVLNSVPFLAGEASAVLLLVVRANVPRGAALSVLAMDQLLVGFAKVTVVLLAALYAPLPDWLRTGVLGLLLGVAALAVVLFPLAHQWRRHRDRLPSGPGFNAAGRLARLLAWGEHFEALRAPRLLVRLVGLAVAKKGLELGAILAIQVAFGLDLRFDGAILVLAALALTTLVPVAPANLGVYEATVFAIYRFLGFPAETALGIAIVQHVCFLLPSTATGYLLVTLRPLRRRENAR